MQQSLHCSTVVMVLNIPAALPQPQTLPQKCFQATAQPNATTVTLGAVGHASPSRGLWRPGAEKVQADLFHIVAAQSGEDHWEFTDAFYSFSLVAPKLRGVKDWHRSTLAVGRW